MGGFAEGILQRTGGERNCSSQGLELVSAAVWQGPFSNSLIVPAPLKRVAWRIHSLLLLACIATYSRLAPCKCGPGMKDNWEVGVGMRDE